MATKILVYPDSGYGWMPKVIKPKYNPVLAGVLYYYSELLQDIARKIIENDFIFNAFLYIYQGPSIMRAEDDQCLIYINNIRSTNQKFNRMHDWYTLLYDKLFFDTK